MTLALDPDLDFGTYEEAIEAIESKWRISAGEVPDARISAVSEGFWL
jgi:hypothetical protein